MKQMKLKPALRLFYIALFFIQFPVLLTFQGNTGMAGIGILLLGFSFYQLVKQKQFDLIFDFFSPFITKKWFKRLYLFIITGWFFAFLAKYLSLGFKVMDTGSFTNPIVNFVKTGVYRNTFLTLHGFADHFTPNLLLIFAPLFKIYPSFLWLILFKSIAYLVCPYLLYKIGTILLGKESKSVYLTPMLWLVHEYLANTMHFSFQPSSLGMPFVLLTFYFAIRKQYLKMMFPLIFIVGFKENMPLLFVVIGFFLFLYHNKRIAGVLLIVIGTAIGFSLFYLVMPYFNDWLPNTQMGRLGPLKLIDLKLKMLLLCYLSVGFLPLLDWRTCFFVLPAFGISFLSGSTQLVSTTYHYLDFPLTVLFVGIIFGLKAWQEKKSWFFSIKEPYKVPLMALSIWGLISFNTQLPQWGIRMEWPDLDDMKILSEVREFRATIPEEYEVMTTNHMGNYLTTHPAIRRFRMKSDDIISMITGFETMELSIKRKQFFVVADEASKSSMNQKEYDLITSWFEQKTKEGILVKVPGYTKLRVYKTNER